MGGIADGGLTFVFVSHMVSAIPQFSTLHFELQVTAPGKQEIKKRHDGFVASLTHLRFSGLIWVTVTRVEYYFRFPCCKR